MSEHQDDGARIEVWEGLEAVRKRPALYVGSVGRPGLHQLVYQAVARPVGEALAGHADAIEVTLMADGGVSVADNGRGIPVALEGSDGRTALEAELTELQAGGYPTSSTYDGMGISVVNALSSRLVVEVRREGFRWSQEYARGAARGPVVRNEETAGRGTTVTFWADAELFASTPYSFTTLARRLRETALLKRGLTISLADERPADAADAADAGGPGADA